MHPRKSSGSNGWVVFLAVLGGIFLLTRVLPVVSKILSFLLVVGLVLLVVAIIMVIYFACKSDEKEPNQEENKNPSENGYVRNDRYNQNQTGGYVRSDQAPGTNYQQGTTNDPNQGNGYNQNGSNRGNNYGRNQNNNYSQNQGNNYGRNQGTYHQPGQSSNYSGNSATNYRKGTASNPGTNYRQGAGAAPNQGNYSPNSFAHHNGQPNMYDRGASTSAGKKEKQAIPPCDLSPETMQILTKGRNHLTELRRLLSRIGNLNVKKRGEDICVEVEKILGALQQQPEDIPMVRQFFNYYLPTLGNILLKYLRLEEAGMATEQTTVKVMSCLAEIKVAMERQYAAIFENDLLDLTVEMESLTQAVKRDGLLVSDDFTIKEGDREITLTV